MTERRRRFLLVSGFALVTSSVLGLAVSTTPSSASTPPPTTLAPTPEPAPTTTPTTVAAPDTLPAPTTVAAPDTLPAPTTVAAPDTLPAPTTTVEAVEPAAPSVVYAANAECDPATGETTVSWKVTNNGDAPVTITGNTEDVPLEPNPVPPLGEATATRVIEGPATDQQVTSTVTIDAGGGVVIEESDEITAGICTGPEPPPDVSFTLSVTPSVTQAAVGDTVEYVYCGQNTSTIPLAEVRLVDDRIGVVLEGEEPIAPGESVCTTDVGIDVSYVVQESDAGGVIHNNAVVSVQTQEDEPREFQQTATADVAVDPVTAESRGVTVPICHRTLSLTNSYIFNAPDESGVTEGGHHYNHTADIIPPGPWAPEGRNWTAEGQALHANGCDNIRLAPASPAVVQATCIGGVVRAPTITTAPETGISYTLAPPAPYDGTVTTPVTVTATLEVGFNWSPMPQGWTQVDVHTATYQVTLQATTCDAVTPVAPGVTEAVCKGGEFHAPTLTPVTTDGIAYTYDPPIDPAVPYSAGQSVLVTATVTQGAWPATMPDGWTRIDNTTATHTVTFADVPCESVTPHDPFVKQPECVDGVVTEPLVTPLGEVIRYTVDPKGPYDGAVDTTVTVTATLGDGYSWGEMPDGWTEDNPTTATFTVELVGAPCDEVTPVAPQVTQAVCSNGAFVPATVTLPTTTGITYNADPPGPYVLLPETVTVTATLDATEVGWPATMPPGWTETSSTVATYLPVVLRAASCLPVLPTYPTVVQATCTAGEVTVPTIELASTPTGVTYVADPLGPYDPGTDDYTVTVTATLPDEGLKWGTMVSPWVKVDNVTATTVVELTGTTCDEVTPVAPQVTQAVCSNGAFVPATVTLPTTTGITYNADPPGPYVLLPETVTVTATLDATEVGWPATMPPGWTETSSTVATYLPVVLRAASCLPVLPTDPTVVQATCTAGEVTVPTIELASTPTGVTYVADPLGPYDPGTDDYTVTVTATLPDEGLKWGTMVSPWVKVDNVTATTVVELTGTTCDEVTPVAPQVTQAVCSNGAFVPATVTLPTTTGITYNADPPGPYVLLPETVTVTATLDATEVGWPATMPPGWTETSSTVATYLPVVLRAASCLPVLPTYPTVVQATCTAGEVTVPTIELASTPTGVTYVADPLGPYDPGTDDYTVTVTATLPDEGLKWGTMVSPWVKVDNVTATTVVELTGTTCDEVTPVAPQVTQAVCSNGAFVPATVTLPTTTGITYNADPPGPYVLLPETVTVTATLDATEVGWPATMPPGWTETSSTVATYLPVVLRAASCLPVLPTDPTVVQATCTAGEVTVPTIELASTPTGVTYVADPLGPYDPGTDDYTVTVTATLPDEGLKWGTMVSPWVKVDNLTATYVVELTGTTCDEVTPVAPSFDQAVCRNGELVPPTLTLPTTDGITYTADKAPPFMPLPELVTVTATLDATDVGWPATMPPGWTETSSTTATYLVRFYVNSCIPVVPEAPDVVQATCLNGEVTVPTITPKVTGFVTYELDPTDYDPGTEDYTVTVTATLSAELVEWGQMPEGWTRVDNLTATYVVELTGTTCDEVTPVAPSFDQAVCRNGELVPPTLTLPTTDGITYTADKAPPFMPLPELVTVTATLDATDVGWPATMPPGWTETSSTTATYLVRFYVNSCIPVVPEAPDVVQATCLNGEVTVPTITPKVTGFVTYELDPTDYDPGTEDYTVTVTATLSAELVEWGQMPEGWTRVDNLTATYVVELTGTTCDEVTPVAPSFDQAVCRNGELVPPTLTLPTTDGITYTADKAPPFMPLPELVTVTATLDATDVGWPATMPPGWTETSSTTATYLVRFYVNSCIPVVPEAPDVVQATCLNGEVTVPTITPKVTGFVTYELDPTDYDPGTEDYTVTVTATLSAELVEWGQMPEGWTRVDNLTATYVVELTGTTCDEVTPVAPSNHAAQCVNGALTPPTLTLAETDGISYSVDADPPYAPGQTVEVTATLDEEGVGWPDQLPEGWTATSDTTATYTHTFDDVTCTPVLPVDPAVVAGSCANGVLTASSVQFEATPGLVYSVDPPGPYDPAAETDVVVTATVIDGYAWEGSDAAPAGFAGRGALDPRPQGAPPPVELPAGWTWVSPTEATFAITLPEAPPCPEVAPTTTAAVTEAESATAAEPEQAPTTTAAAEEPTTSAAEPTVAPTTTSVPVPIPETGASGLPGQLLVAFLALSSGLALIMLGRRRQGVG